MGLMKRSRPLIDDGEEEESEDIVEIDSAQSRLPNGTRKKQRLSANTQDIPDSGDTTNSLDDTDEDLDALEVSQFGADQHRKGQQENLPVENGIIESITCTNFMCHTYLEVSLGPLINFIIGHNGSGKSAVLTALTLCLGGKASGTNRGGNLKSFIKEGQESCVLTVKLKNKGESAYQSEVYGDSIIIERHFSKAGTSGFKLKSSNGRLISSRKSDLEEICDYFALQLDNPMSVLTQDMARQFLNNSSPQEKYKFFVKGTQLEILDQDYNLIEESINKIQAPFHDLEQVIENHKQRFDKAQKRLEESNSQDKMRSNVRRIRNQMAWVQVEEQEQYLKTYDDDLKTADDALVSAERRVVNTTSTFEEANSSCDQASQSAQEAKDEVHPLQEEKNRLKEEFDKTKAEAQDVHTDHRKIAEILKASKAGIKKAKDDIAEEYRRLEEANGGSQARRLANLDILKSNVIDQKQQQEDYDRNLRSLEDQRTTAEQDLKNFKTFLQRKQNEVEKCQARTKDLESNRGQQQPGYHPNMSQLVKAIRHDDGFQQKPIGPIGDYVHLLKPAWSSILEKTFGGTLNSFIVISKQDQARLSTLMQRTKCPGQVLIGSNNSFDFSNKEPDEEFDTILRILEIRSDLVVRQLVINQGIEQTILIEDMEEANKRMDDVRLRNVKQCFSMNPAKPGAGMRIGYGWGGNLSSTAIDPYEGMPRMKTDDESQIRYQQDILHRLQRERRALSEQHQKLQKVVEECKKAVAAHYKRAEELRVAVQRAEASVEELQDSLDSDAVEEGRLDALKGVLNDFESDKTVQESSYEECVVVKDRLAVNLKDYKEKMRAMDIKIAEAEAKVYKAEKKTLGLAAQRETALSEKNAAFQLLVDSQEKRQEYVSGREEVMARVVAFTEGASRVSARVPIPPEETGATLEKKLDRAITILKESEDRLGGNKQQMIENVAIAKKDYKSAKNQFESEKKLSQVLNGTLRNRRDRWKIFQRSITGRARVQFVYLLTERNFRGRLKVQHSKRMLDLDVQPDQTQDSSGRKTKTLSGGEKSFSTICLLLSLWEAMGTPIRCLDEFDVFMDTVNREVSMSMIVAAAERSAGRQFILITPQSMSKVAAVPNVKIIKMNDPERGQTTISFPVA